MHQMRNMEALTYLEISTSYSSDNPNMEAIKTIEFSQLIEACPTILTDLFLSGLYLTFNEPISNQTSIEYLDLSHIYLDQHLAKVIETSFPQLVQLMFYSEVPSGVTISLPNHNLEVVDIKVRYSRIGGDIGFAITTTDDNLVEYYGKGESEDYDEYSDNDGGVTLLSKEEFHHNPVLSLTCAFVDDLYLEVESHY
jgi:hypothetical protein